MAKKKRGNKAKNNNNNNNKLLAISIITLFVFTFALNFVGTSVDNPSIADYEVGLAPVGDTTNNFKGFIQRWIVGPFESGKGLDVKIAKYLLFFVVTIFLWSVLNFSSFPPNRFFQFLIAVPVAFLSVAYITPEEIFSILTTYTALGMTLSVILPFIAILLTAAMILSVAKISQMTVGKILIQQVIWLFWVGYLLYKLITGYGEGNDMSTGANIVIYAVLGLSVLITVFNKHFRTYLTTLGFELKRLKGQDIASDATQDAVIKATDPEEGVWF